MYILRIFKTFFICFTTYLIILSTQPGATYYGEALDEMRDDQLAEQFEYGIQNQRVIPITTVSGAVTTNNSLAVVSTGLSSGSTAAIQSARYIRYQPARESYAIFSVAFTSGVSGTSQWMGCFDSLDGFALGYDGATFSILYRNSVTGSTVDTVIPQASFNLDPLNGTGPSGINLDPTKLNIFRIQYSWLGATPIQFALMNSAGQFITFHTIIQANLFVTPSLSIPQLPMRAEVANLLTSNNVSISTAGWNAGIIDTFRNPANSRIFCVSSTIPSLTLLAGEVHMFTIQNPNTFNSKTNKIEAKICMVGGGSMNTSALGTFIRVLQDATISSPSYTPVSVGNSIMNISTTGTYVVGTGIELMQLPSNSYGDGPNITYSNLKDCVIDIILLPGDTITFTVQVTADTTVPIIGVIGWDERF